MSHYRNSIKTVPSILDPKKPQIGFSNVKVSIEEDVLTCSFTRMSIMPNVNYYFDSNDKYYLLFATGLFNNGISFILS